MPINLLKLNVRPVAYLHYYSRKINPPDKVLQSLHLLGLPEFCTLIFRGCLVAGLLPRMLLQSLRLARESRVEVTTQVPEQNYEPLWHYEKQREILSFWKDSEYMRWRYERHPHLSPKFFGLYEGDELTALAVLVSVKGEATIADLIVKDRRLQRARYLVSKILMHCCLNDRENKKVVFMGHDRGFFPAVFADFTLLPERDFPFCLRFLSNKEKLEPLAIAAESWTLTGGDTDSLY